MNKDEDSWEGPKIWRNIHLRQILWPSRESECMNFLSKNFACARICCDLTIFFCLFQVHLVVATPGRILDLMEKKIADVNNCKILCLDEADKLLSQDFKGMLDRLISHLPEQRQILLYSATFPLTVEHFMVSKIFLFIIWKRTWKLIPRWALNGFWK